MQSHLLTHPLQVGGCYHHACVGLVLFCPSQIQTNPASAIQTSCPLSVFADLSPFFQLKGIWFHFTKLECSHIYWHILCRSVGVTTMPVLVSFYSVRHKFRLISRQQYQPLHSRYVQVPSLLSIKQNLIFTSRKLECSHIYWHILCRSVGVTTMPVLVSFYSVRHKFRAASLK